MKGGIRQRLGLTQSKEKDGQNDEIAASSSSGPSGRGGVRQRLGLQPAPESEASTQGRAGGIKRKTTSTSDDAAVGDQPLNNLLKKQWSQGKMSARVVSEIAGAASSQGAVGVDLLSSDLGNEHRHLLSAFPYPKNAPPIEWIEVTTKDGKAVPHPILCPIAVVERLLVHFPEMFDQNLRGAHNIQEFWNKLKGGAVSAKCAHFIDELMGAERAPSMGTVRLLIRLMGC